MITSQPPQVNTAFNPLIFKGEKGLSVLDYETIIISKGLKSVELSASYINDIAFLNASPIVRNWFNDSLAEMTNKIVVDEKLGIKWSDGTNEYLSINSALQVKEKIKSQAEVLSYKKEYIKYEGYPMDISILAYTGFVSNKGEFQTNSVSRLRIDDNEEALIFDSLLATSKGNLFQTSKYNYIGFDETTQIDFLQNCTPLNPFYVRWINTLGGVDYHMFSVNQETKTTLSKTELFEPYIITDENYKEKPYAKEGGVTITAGAENLSIYDYKALSLLPMSHYIEWYNEELKEWIYLNVSKTDNKSFSNESKQFIEIEFELPKLNLQF